MKGRHILIIEGHLAANQNEKDHTETPDINLRTSIRFGLEKFGGSKVKTTAVRLQLSILVRREEIAKAEIDNLDVSRFADQDVFDLEITVDNAVAVAVIDSARYLSCELSSLFFLELPVGDDVVQHLTAVNVFKEHVPMPSRP